MVYYIFSYFCFSFILLLTSLGLKSSGAPKLPPQYRNRELEKIIANNANNSTLDLCEKWLHGKDMEIVTYYALRNNEV